MTRVEVSSFGKTLGLAASELVNSQVYLSGGSPEAVQQMLTVPPVSIFFFPGGSVWILLICGESPGGRRETSSQNTKS